MKKQISLSVTTPCSENWNNFEPTSNGGFCSACSKNVIDFTKMSETEIHDFFSTKPAYTCGRFRKDQLKIYSQTNTQTVRPGLKWVHAGFLSFMLILANKEGSAKSVASNTSTEIVQYQDHQHEKKVCVDPGHVITGTVIDEYNEPLPAVNIYLKGTAVGTLSDVEGKFKFPKELQAGDVLVFNYIGYETTEYVVPKDAPATIEIPMLTLHMELMGEVMVDEVYAGEASVFGNWWQKIKRLF